MNARVERAERFLHNLASVLDTLPAWLTWALVGVQVAGFLVWFGAIRPKQLERRPGLPLAVIYAVSPLYIFVLSRALQETLWPGGVDQMGDSLYFAYVLGSLFLSILPAAFALWLATTPKPPKRFVPKWLRSVNAPPTEEHGIRRDQSSA